MAKGMKGLAGYLWLLLLLLLGVHLVAAEEVLTQVEVMQRSLASGKELGEFTFDWGGDEIFHVDMERKETVWRLPQFGKVVGFQAEGVLANLALLHNEVDVFVSLTNSTPAQNVPPKVTLYPEKPVELGEPNVLVCLANEFSPSIISLTWLKNGQEVKAVDETDFYPSTDNSFRKFSYLTFVPNAEDIYYCRVEHGGLAQPLTREWNADMAEPHPETAESVVCGLGLAVGIVGIIVGTVFFIKGRRNNEANFRRRPM
ncbi:UNVERIFIED_CONTAM: hypothetical protein K2H54_066497 [Gekko kuhli]